ncbi:hypothetical protein BLA60_16100 [Actinophytocola xinjiangensis]|uniref:Uncharacterized protein n=1 Tax=Actinophytocola xinjiangensis TaxID=485602 RepID=A0A7Z1AXS0_9PSEU|nr:hypothetical protein [Actinophytocola xinjiangensis]OLF10684.1 hypothetical protein BLA60_16100 [Actinophytocola xinjiangensis]
MSWVWIAVAVVVVAAGALTPLLTGRRQRALASNDEAVAARSRYHQLGHYVEDGPEHVTDERAAALLRTARERWLTAGSLLARATTEADFTQAEAVAVEGLGAVADAHVQLGRPGPRVPRRRDPEDG